MIHFLEIKIFVKQKNKGIISGFCIEMFSRTKEFLLTFFFVP